jgi:hypothetical protein
MADNPGEKNRDLDDLLAEFTDRTLNPAKDEPVQLDIQDTELQGLEQVVMELKKLHSDPPPALARRIQANLAAGWRQAQPVPVAKRKPATAPGWRDRLRWLKQSISPPRFALGFAVAAVTVLAAVWLISPFLNSPISGTAGISGSWLPVVLAGGCVLAIVAYLLFRRRS